MTAVIGVEVAKTKSQSSVSASRTEQRVVVRIGEGQRDDVDTVHVTAMPALGFVARQLNPAQLVGAADQRHLMPTRD